MTLSLSLCSVKRGGHRPPFFFGVSLLMVGLAGAPHDPVQAQTVVVYRCDGPSVLYTDALSPQQARQRGCTPIDPLPLTVGEGRILPAPEAVGTPSASKSAAARPAALSPEARAREQQALRILQAEWTRETQALATLQTQSGAQGPATEAERVKQQQAIARKQADLQALQREIARRQEALAP